MIDKPILSLVDDIMKEYTTFYQNNDYLKSSNHKFGSERLRKMVIAILNVNLNQVHCIIEYGI